MRLSFYVLSHLLRSACLGLSGRCFDRALPTACVYGLAPLALAQAVAPTQSAPTQAPLAACVVTHDQLDEPSLTLQMSTRLQNPDPNAETTRFLLGDNIQGSPTSELTIQGQAEVRLPGTVLKAEQIRFNRYTDTLYAQENVHLYKDGNIFTGSSLVLKMDTRTGALAQPTFFLPEVNGRGQATTLQFINRAQAALQQADYSTCSPAQKDWYVKAEHLLIDTDAQEVSGSNGTLYFKDVPILYLPKYSFGIGEQRRTGFLTPYFSTSSRSGFQLTTPYYLNLAPNRDLTLFPSYYTRRGEQLGADFRYIGERNLVGQLRGEYMPHDQVVGSDRYLYSWQHNQLLGSRLNLLVNYNQVSDNNYLTDFSRTLVVSSQSFLPRDMTLNYVNPNGNSYLRFSDFQTLQNASTPITPPYARLPQLGTQQRLIDYQGLDAAVILEASRFEHPTLQTGERYFAVPNISYPLIAPYGFITPKASLHAIYYTLDANATSGASSSREQLQVPTYSLDSGLIFERATELFGTKVKQTLEPRLFYVRTPYRDQSNLPNFDSALADINFAQIFAENAFSGRDRVSDADQLTAAVSSRFINDVNGQERLRLALAQRFNFQTPMVTLPGSTPSNQRKSDLLFAGYGQISQSVYADAGLQVNAQDNSARRYNAALRYLPERGKSLTTAYRYREDEFRQLDFAAQWPLSENLYAVGRINYSLIDRQAVENLAGIEYRGGCGCWILRTVAQRFASAANTSTTAVFLQLELTGFGNLGSDPLAILRRNVPGYSMLSNPAANPSRFTNYE